MLGVKKLMNGLNVIEKIALVLSLFYGLGMCALIQYNAYFIGGECLDFLRIKPILVGVQYVVYLILPALVFCTPVYYWKYCALHVRWLKIVLLPIVAVAVLVVPSIMFHYFFPYANDVANGNISFYWNMPIEFWSMFFYWDFFHVLGMLLAVSLFFVLTCLKKVIPSKVLAVWFLAVLVLNLFYFNHDVYVNVVQSAGGGAPRAGIITIANPSEMMKRANVEYMTLGGEISKPCFILEENSDHYIIGEMFQNYHDKNNFSEVDMRASVARIGRDTVKQFSPINLSLFFKNHTSLRYDKYLTSDIIHQLDVVLNLGYSVKPSTLFNEWQTPDFVSTTNDVVLSWWTENEGVRSVKSSRIKIGLMGHTNLVCQIKFSGVEYPRGIYVGSLERKLKECNAHVQISGLPPMPTGFLLQRAQMAFVCNFVYAIQCDWWACFKDGLLLLKSQDEKGLNLPVGVAK